MTANSANASGFEWRNIRYSVFVPGDKKGTKSEKILLDSVNGCVRPGELVAILGPSGAGKTTLLNILAGRAEGGNLSGSILYEGNTRNKRAWKKQTGYVEQEDIMYRTLTVRENLQYAARLRLPNEGWSAADKLARVDHVLRHLGLVNCADTRIGNEFIRGISGGERKRVSIGMELVTDPQLLFLDEPTSGLDAFTALNVVEQCKKLARDENKSVLMTIHQPRTDILSLFDKILLLCQGGRVAFFGSLPAALKHFHELGFECPGNVNPADFFLDQISIDDRTDERRDSSRRNLDLFADTWARMHQKELLPVPAHEEPLKGAVELPFEKPWLAELGILLERNFRDTFRDRIYIVATLFQTLFISILLGCTYLQIPLEQTGIQTRIGSLFFIATNLMFSIIQPVILLWPLERLIIVRERAGHCYRTSAAFVAKSISLLPLRMFASLTMGTILYFLLGYQLDYAKYLIFIAIVLAFSFCALSLGLMLGSATPSVNLAQILAPMIIVTFLIYGGNIGSKASIPVALSWIQYISPMKYCYTALFRNEFSGLAFIPNPSPAMPSFTDGQQVIQLYEMDSFPIYACILILLGMGLIFQFLGFLALRRMTRPKLNLSI